MSEPVPTTVRPYCTKYGTYLPAGEFKNGWTAHHECSPDRHVLVTTREYLEPLRDRLADAEAVVEAARGVVRMIEGDSYVSDLRAALSTYDKGKG